MWSSSCSSSSSSSGRISGRVLLSFGNNVFGGLGLPRSSLPSSFSSSSSSSDSLVAYRVFPPHSSSSSSSSSKSPSAGSVSEHSLIDVQVQVGVQEEVVDACAGWSGSGVTTNFGRCFHWGWRPNLRSFVRVSWLQKRFPRLISLFQNLPLSRFSFQPRYSQPTLLQPFDLDSHPPLLPDDTFATSLVAGGAHLFALSRSGVCWSWGEGFYGQLGHDKRGSEVWRTYTAGPKMYPVTLRPPTPPPPRTSPAPAPNPNPTPVVVPDMELEASISVVKKVACGFQHTLILSDSGVYACGKTDSGALGLGDAIVKSEGNQLFGPQLIPSTGLGRVVDISCGFRHSLLLTDSGEVYAMGKNAFGQCGVYSDSESISGSHKPIDLADVRVPRRVVGGGIENERMIAIACGAHHSLALSATGRLWSWGYNKQGQCGRHNTQAIAYFSHLPRSLTQQQSSSCILPPGPLQLTSNQILNAAKTARTPLNLTSTHAGLDELGSIVSISCGLYDSAIITSKGRCLLIGGHLSQEKGFLLRFLFPHLRVRKIALGYAHGLAIVDDPNQSIQSTTSLY